MSPLVLSVEFVGITPIDVTNTDYTDHDQKRGEANRK